MRLLDNDLYREDVERVANSPLNWELFHDSTVVLSGASGMIGSFLVDVLMARNIGNGMNCTVHALARDFVTLSQRFEPYSGHTNLVLMSADVSVDELPFDRVDYVIHAASNTHPVAYAQDPVGTIMTNVQGTHAMMSLAHRANARRAVFLSTVEIYGENRGDAEKFVESDMGYIDCNTVRAGYPESKRTGEALCQAFRDKYAVDVVIVRLPRVFGPTVRPDDTKAMSQFLLKAVEGEDIVLKSDGNQHYSYCHVADAVAAMLLCLGSGRSGEAYNVAHPSCDVRLRDLAQLVAATAGKHVVFELPGEVEARGFSKATLAVMDGEKIAGLGWKPMFDMSQGVERTVAVLKELAA